MPLIDALAAAGLQPPKVSAVQFFAQHPGLLDEVRAVRAARFTWPQICDGLEAEYGYRPDPKSLSRMVASP